MSITGILLVAISLVAFDSDSDLDYQDTQTVADTDSVELDYGINDSAEVEVDYGMGHYTDENIDAAEQYYYTDRDDSVVEGMGHDYNDPYYADRDDINGIDYDYIRSLPIDDRYNPTTGEPLYPEVDGPEWLLSQSEIDEINQYAVN